MVIMEHSAVTEGFLEEEAIKLDKKDHKDPALQKAEGRTGGKPQAREEELRVFQEGAEADSAQGEF